MAATVIIQEITGPFNSETWTEKNTFTGSRYYTSDDFASGATTNPIPIPTNNNGLSGSYWKSHCLYISVAPDVKIENVRYYQTWSVDPNTDWSLGTNGDLVIGISSATVDLAREVTNGFPSSSYMQANGVEGTYGWWISGSNPGHQYYSGCTAPLSGGATTIADFDSLANAFMVQSGQVVGATTGRSWCIVTQVLVGSGASQGIADYKTATFVYSET